MTNQVRILIDAGRLLPSGDGALEVESASDYARACLAIRSSLYARSTLSLYVRDRAVAQWLSALSKGYGDTRIVVEAYTARSALGAKWGVEVPPEVSDHDILQSRLLQEDATVREGQTFWDTLLEHFFGDVFVSKLFPQKKLGQLITKIGSAGWQDAMSRPLAQRAASDKMSQWERAAHNDALIELGRRLRTEPDNLKGDLVAYRLLRNYPLDLGRKVLGDALEVIRGSGVEVDGLTPREADAAPFLPDIEYYLAGAAETAASGEDVSALVAQMSGCLPVEFNVVESLLQQKPEWLTHGLVAEIARRFRPIERRLRSNIERLRDLVPPAFPPEPDVTWDVATWLDWVRDAYMPYYRWLDTQARHDSTLAAYASCFADWYYDNFVELKNGAEEHFAFSALYRQRTQMLDADAITLVLVLDNFNFTYFDRLCMLLQRAGFSLQDSAPTLSLAPTATEIGKAGVMAGRGDPVDLPAGSYRSLLMREWGQVLDTKRVSYLSNVGELQQIKQITHDVYFLNYLTIDKILHEDNRDTGRSHAEEITDSLEALVRSVVDFATRLDISERLHINVVSDHGSTRISSDIVNVLDRAFYQGLTLDSHHRFIPLPDDKFEALPQVASAQCYLMDRHRFKTKESYLVARQYYRFIETEGNFYVHGGLTPEEVVVPFARFAQTEIIPIAPTVRLMNSIFRYAIASKVVFEIGNPNNFPLENVLAQLVGTDTQPVIIERLKAKRNEQFEISARFRKIAGAGKSRILTLQVEYQSQGGTHVSQEYTFEITLKSLVEEKDDLDF